MSSRDRGEGSTISVMFEPAPGGLGMELALSHAGHIVVTAVDASGPAHAQGVRVNDSVVGVDSEAVGPDQHANTVALAKQLVGAARARQRPFEMVLQRSAYSSERARQGASGQDARTVGARAGAATQSQAGPGAAALPSAGRKERKWGGMLGLRNLGNTCFMNSALQCLSHTSRLTGYFVDGAYKRDLNRENVLGTQGRLAEAYADLLVALWPAEERGGPI